MSYSCKADIFVERCVHLQPVLYFLFEQKLWSPSVWRRKLWALRLNTSSQVFPSVASMSSPTLVNLLVTVSHFDFVFRDLASCCFAFVCHINASYSLKVGSSCFLIIRYQFPLSQIPFGLFYISSLGFIQYFSTILQWTSKVWSWWMRWNDCLLWWLLIGS